MDGITAYSGLLLKQFPVINLLGMSIYVLVGLELNVGEGSRQVRTDLGFGM